MAGGAAAEFLKDRPSTLPTTRPAAGDLASRPGASTLPARPGGDVGRPGRPGDGDIGRPGRPGEGQWATHRPDRITDRAQWNDWRQNNFTNVNNYCHGHWDHFHNWYGHNWWNHYPGWRWRFPNNVNWWAWGTWAAVSSWIPWGWGEPVYYNYGSNVYYQGDSVYYGDQPVATSAEYADQAQQIATSIPDVDPAPEDWMSLGVFAMVPDGESTSADPTMFVQLAVSKQGIIAGSFTNSATSTEKSLEGMVDKQTQRAAWTEVGRTRPIMETGVSNLTQETVPALMHYADGTTQQWLLVRLEAPEGSGQSSTPRQEQ